MHPPVEDGECTACHNPHGSDHETMLVASSEKLCFECHDEFPAVTATHSPVEDGDCTACHNPHSSDHGAMLVASSEKLCFECHDEFPAETSMHSPVEDGDCTACHNPHGSDHETILTVSPEELCFECHEDGMNDPVAHAALDDGCGECHRPHTSPYPRLFTANLTLDRLTRFAEEQAELCFNCHEVDVLTAPRSDETEFRHGQENLHALHLTGGAKPNKYGFTRAKDGQTCVACHLPHTSLQERLVRGSFECKGIACYTMRFRPNETGGTCIVGCHKPRTYSREASEESSARAVGRIIKAAQKKP
jgi:predicted CXXCH cytochrome family protein